MRPEDILVDHELNVRAVAHRLRAIIQATMPEASERAYPGWHAIGYRHPKAGYVCAIFPLADCVRLAFEHGHLIPDPHHILTLPPTSSKQVRYWEISQASAIDEDQLATFLLAAVAAKGGEYHDPLLARTAGDHG